MFLYQGWYFHGRKGNLVFNIRYDKFWIYGDFFGRNLDAKVELHQYQSLSQGIFFLTEWYYFFLLWACCCWTFLRFLFFHEQRFFLKQKASTCEFCKVRDVNKIWKEHENKPQHVQPQTFITCISNFTRNKLDTLLNTVTENNKITNTRMSIK